MSSHIEFLKSNMSIKTIENKINTFEIISCWNLSWIEAYVLRNNVQCLRSTLNSNMTSFKPVVKIIYIYTHCNLWRHRQFITIFYQFLHIRIKIIHGSHMYILPWHLLGHAIKSVICFDLQFSHSTRPMTSFCIFIAYINTEGILFNVKITRWD